MDYRNSRDKNKRQKKIRWQFKTQRPRCKFPPKKIKYNFQIIFVNGAMLLSVTSTNAPTLTAIESQVIISYQFNLVFFLKIPSDSKTLHVIRTLLSILADVNSVVV